MTRRRPMLKKQGSGSGNQTGQGQSPGDQMTISENAFASAVTEQQYAVTEENDVRRFLSDSIEMHASTIKEGEITLDLGELDELEGGGDMAPVSSGPVSEPPPKSIAAAIGNRIFASFGRKENDGKDVEGKKHNGILQDDVSIRSSNSRNTARSSISLSGRFDVKRIDPDGVVYPFQTRNAWLVRIAVAAACFISSLILSSTGGGGKIGLSIASNYYSSSIANAGSHHASQPNPDYQSYAVAQRNRNPEYQNYQDSLVINSYESETPVHNTEAPPASKPTLPEIPKPSTEEEEIEELNSDKNLETIENLASMNIAVSPHLTKNLAEITSPIPVPKTETAIFWQIPKTGSTVIRIALSECLGLVEAHDLAAINDDAVIKVEESIYGIKFVNVDTTSLDGIQRAKFLQLASSSLADVAYTPFLPELLDIFSPKFRARIFTLFRDPVDRTVSLYHYEQKVDEEVANMSLVDYIRSEKYIDNYMTRTLTQKFDDQLHKDDLLQAMEFIRKYIVVGLLEEIETSIIKFTEHFGWNARLDQGKNRCLQNLSHRVNIGPHGVHKGTMQWDWVHSVNKLDYQLYLYARYVFSK